MFAMEKAEKVACRMMLGEFASLSDDAFLIRDVGFQCGAEIAV